MNRLSRISPGKEPTAMMMAKVTRTFTKGYVEILLPKEDTACDGKCASCGKEPCPRFDGNCDRAVAETTGKKLHRGDIVEVKRSRDDVDQSHLLVYAVPVIIFLAGCFLGKRLGQQPVDILLTGAILGLLTFVLAWIYDRRSRMRKLMTFEIVRLCRPRKEDHI